MLISVNVKDNTKNKTTRNKKVSAETQLMNRLNLTKTKVNILVKVTPGLVLGRYQLCNGL